MNKFNSWFLETKKIKLRNFRNHDYLQFDFKKGITIFTGPNGAGKTSILEAVAFVASTKSFRAGKNEDFIQHEKESAQEKQVVKRIFT